MNENDSFPPLTAEGVEEFLATDDRETVDVHVPEWKRTVRIRQLTAEESMVIADTPKNEGMLTLVALSVVDAHGNRVFKDPDRLKGKSAAGLSRIQDAALKLNGFTAART